MKIERTKNSFRSTAFGSINRIINILVPFIIRTIIIKILGEEYLGLNSLFTSILQVLSLTELGLGSAMIYNMYSHIANDDYDKINELLNTYKILYRIISIAIAIIGLALLPLLPYIIDMESINSVNINVYLLYVIYLANTVISYGVFAYKKAVIQAYQRNDIISIVGSVTNILLYITQIILLMFFKDYYFYALCLPAFTCITNIVDGFCANKLYPHFKRQKNKLSKENLMPIWASVKALIGHKVGAVLISSFDSIVISAFLQISVLAIYGNYHYVITALIGFVNIGYNAILAGVGNCIATEGKDKIYSLFRQLTLLIAMVVGLCSTCLLCLYQPFMELWLGQAYMFSFDTVILFVVYFYTWQIRVIGLNFKDAAGMWKNDFWKPYVGIAVNLIGNIVLVQFMGVNGVLFSTIITMCLIYFPWETAVLHRDLFNCKSVPYYLVQLKYLITTVLSCISSYFICSLLPLYGIVGLIVRGVICTVDFCILFIIANMKDTEFKALFSRMKNIVHRR